MMKRSNAQQFAPNLLHKSIWLFGVAAFALSGCVNSNLNSLANRIGDLDTTTTSSTTTAAADYLKIANVTIAVPANSSATTPTATLFFDTSQSTAVDPDSGPARISNHCAVTTGSDNNTQGCVCRFTWNESSGSTSGSSSSSSIRRTVETPLVTVQATLATCLAPSVYSSEIDNGVSLKISVVPSSSSSESFGTSTFSYTKNTNQVTGSFRDAEGHAFDNVVHYACHEQFKRGTVIANKIKDPDSNPPDGFQKTKYPMANQFCVQKGGDGTGAAAGTPSGCEHIPTSLSYSAQAYYYNFFIRATEVGDINTWNDRYSCPLVKEALYNGGSAGSQGGVWPKDSTFALSMGRTTDFNVGVDAFVELSNGGNDPVAASAKTCAGASVEGNASTSGFVRGCLGFATKPSSDGSCPYFRDSSGAIRFTYRLRRFVALYPPLFKEDGSQPTQPQALDTIYVLDRPVTPPAGSDPLKPYTMRGPKPCPFALFDSKGVMGVTDSLGGVLPAYWSTNNAGWNGKNVDGLQFPNVDSASSATSGPSCAAALPIFKNDPLNPNQTTFSVATLNADNPVYKSMHVRPIHAWAPHYEEDTEFQACAPQAAPLRDPPLHFAKDTTTGNVSWCAESYPSQNDNVTALDHLADTTKPASTSNKYVGYMRPYTSHVAKNSASSTCTATVPATIPSGGLYPSTTGAACSLTGTPTGLARHPSDALVDTKNAPASPFTASAVCANNTCDRTAITPGLQWTGFPLLATPTAVEQAISSDSTFSCTLTFDNGGAKTGKITPTQGCCGNSVYMSTGIFPTPTTREQNNSNAHLEPGTACLTPKY